MKIKSKNIIININNTLDTPKMNEILQNIEKEICMIDNPVGCGKFILHAKFKSNGVKPIKENFMSSLQNDGWILENRLDVGVTTTKPGPIDATYPFEDSHIALEWETGNISSSHRAINKMVSGLIKGSLICGVLVLPSREMYNYLTDRVGNFRELEPYFPVWKYANYNINRGALVIYEIEHDEISSEIPPFKKGTDGRALR
jgi:hypothetical protein